MYQRGFIPISTLLLIITSIIVVGLFSYQNLWRNLIITQEPIKSGSIIENNNYDLFWDNFGHNEENKKEFNPDIVTENQQALFRDKIYGYEMDLSNMPGATTEWEVGDGVYPYSIYTVEIFPKKNGTHSIARFTISAPLENPATFSLEKYAGRILGVKEGTKTWSEDYSDNEFKSTTKITINNSNYLVWETYSEGIGPLWSKSYLININDKIIYTDMISWTEGDFKKAINLYDYAVTSLMIKEEKYDPDKAIRIRYLRFPLPTTLLKLTPNWGNIGDQIQIEGSGWPPNVDLVIEYDILSWSSDKKYPPQLEVKTDNKGEFSSHFTITDKVQDGMGIVTFIASNKKNNQHYSRYYTQRGEAFFYLLKY